MNSWATIAAQFIAGAFAITMVALVLSQKAQTSQVLKGVTSLVTGTISAAVSPVTGQSTTGFTSY